MSKLKMVLTCASRGRNPDDPTGDRGKSNGRFVQTLEIGGGQHTNTITSVAKDYYLLEVYE